MKIGMLWYDDDPKRTLDEKVRRAAKFYQEKYGVAAAQCHVNPRSNPDKLEFVDAIALKPNTSIIQNHFWLGVADDQTPPKNKGSVWA